MSNQEKQGKILVIEGTDCSGKTTQYEMLTSRLQADGIKLGTSSFPNYKEPSCYFVESYLHGEYSDKAEDISPKAASIFYALDRYDSFKRKEWGKVYREGKNILFARYISSNILHQANKYDSEEEKLDFINWLYDLETNELGIPKEDKVVLLDMPPYMAQELMKKRLEEQNGLTSSGTDKDIHEGDKEHLEKAYNTAISVANILGWDVIHCVDANGRLKTREEINDELYTIAKDLYVGN